MEEAGIQPNADLRWIQVDIADWEKLQDVIQRVRDHGSVDYVVSLAAHYDFTNKDHPEYTRTNIQGTRNMLELAKELGVKRFLFASSQAACPFGSLVTEETQPNAAIPYAKSKKAGEELVKDYAQWVPGAIVRIAAVFSDWCEYPPLYALLNNWLSGKLAESHIIAGHGHSAIPYIHVHDLAQFFLRVIEKSDDLERLCTFNAGPDGAVSHLELFQLATQFYYKKTLHPVCINRWLLAPMILVRQILNLLQGKESFEQLWMLKYVDQQLVADSSRTRRELSWRPTPRKSIRRRLIFLIENMKKNPELWRSWNEAMLHKEVDRSHMMLHERLCNALDAARDKSIDMIAVQLLDASELDTYSTDSKRLGALDKTVLNSYIRLLYQMIVTVIRTRNRPMLQQQAHTIVFLPMIVGFGSGLASSCLFGIGEYMVKQFRNRAEFQQLSQHAEDYVTMTIHLAVDQIEDQAELSRLQSQVVIEGFKKMSLPASSDLDYVMRQLEDLCNEVISGQSWTKPLANGEPGGKAE
jgi:nucleoside-diphosphate-sugar epimerase